MAKMRVYELAKEFEITSEALIHLLREMDVPVRSHMSSLDDGQVARVRTRMERDKRRPEKEAKKDAGTRRRRRRRVVEKPAEPAAGPFVRITARDEVHACRKKKRSSLSPHPRG